MIEQVGSVITYLNGSKWFVGCIILMNTLTSKYIGMDIPQNAEKIMSIWLRRVGVFGLAFIVSRDIFISLIITIAFILIFNYLLNEKSKACIIPKNYLKLDTNDDGIVSEKELDHALKVLEKMKRANQITKKTELQPKKYQQKTMSFSY